MLPACANAVRSELTNAVKLHRIAIAIDLFMALPPSIPLREDSQVSLDFKWRLRGRGQVGFDVRTLYLQADLGGDRQTVSADARSARTQPRYSICPTTTIDTVVSSEGKREECGFASPVDRVEVVIPDRVARRLPTAPRL